MKMILSLAAAASLAIPAAPALSQNAVKVEYADLNLDSREGQERLEARIRRAVEDVCEIREVPTGSRIRSRDSRDCEMQAFAKARQQVAAIIEDRKLGG